MQDFDCISWAFELLSASRNLFIRVNIVVDTLYSDLFYIRSGESVVHLLGFLILTILEKEGWELKAFFGSLTVRIHNQHQRVGLIAEFANGSFRCHKCNVFLCRRVASDLLRARFLSVSHATDTVPSKAL